MKKQFTILIILCFLLGCWTMVYAQANLPLGSNPPAIDYTHFPNRTFALIWRNWNLVAPERIAASINCSPKQVNEIAAAMGLKKAIAIPADFKRRMYITVVRRNWHLLPYEQLLALLDMSAQELEVALKDDDFLYVKLGDLKPNVSRIVYSAPTQEELNRAKEIKQLIAKQFKKLSGKPEARLQFIEEFTTRVGASKVIADNQVDDGLRYIYSYFGVFGDPLIDTSIDPYPEGLLAKLADKGINGVWMHVVLNQMAPGSSKFPEFGENHQQRIDNLRKIVERANKYGIKVYLYMNEPRGMPLSFFENRPEMAGVKEGGLAAMCTSNPDVNDWISNSLTYIFKQVPDLGGVFSITGSENLTSCASHGQQNNCPHCSKRSFSDIIAGVNKTIADGVHKANPKAKVIVWDWGWNHVAPDIIAKLPKSVWFMSVSEWASLYERGGIKAHVGEYSMSVVGPGETARNNWKAAREAGLKTVAKVQFNNTWELSAVPWLPVMDLVAKHAAQLAQEKVDGLMLSWSLGGYPSPNLEIARVYSIDPKADEKKVLDDLAEKYYGRAAVAEVRKAWTAFSQAFQLFPFSANVIYKAPLQSGPANLVFAKSTGYAATMVGIPYDNLNGWIHPYPQDVFISQFDQLANEWKKGLEHFANAVKLSRRKNKGTSIRDYNMAEAAYIHFASVANQATFILSRDSLLNKNVTAANKRILKGKIKAVLTNEIELSKKLYEITSLDSRIGFEASNQYFYVPQDLMEKVINCEFVMKQLEI